MRNYLKERNMELHLLIYTIFYVFERMTQINTVLFYYALKFRTLSAVSFLWWDPSCLQMSTSYKSFKTLGWDIHFFQLANGKESRNIQASECCIERWWRPGSAWARGKIKSSLWTPLIFLVFKRLHLFPRLCTCCTEEHWHWNWIYAVWIWSVGSSGWKNIFQYTGLICG